MENKKIFLKNLAIAITVALIGALFIASYFIPILSLSENYRKKDLNQNFSCRDVVVAMNAKEYDSLSDAQKEAVFVISKTEGTPGKLIRVVGVMGMINAMIGATIMLCALATLILKNSILKFSALSFSVAALCVSIAMLALICTYLGTKTTSMQPYSYYYSISAGTFIMLAASLFCGVGSYFLGYFDKKEEKK